MIDSAGLYNVGPLVPGNDIISVTGLSFEGLRVKPLFVPAR